jgi:transposase
LIEGRDCRTAVAVRAMDVETEENDGDGNRTIVEERVVLCRSEGRRQKESAIRSKAEEKLLADLKALAERVGAGRLKDPAKIQRAIGRVLQKNPRVARYYAVAAEPVACEKPADFRITWQRRNDTWQDDQDMFGCYVLRTDRRDLPADELWQLYMTLCHAEDGFQALKSDLGLRPNYHQIEDRVDAHVFITVLAYHLLQFIQHKLACNGDTRSWFTLRRILQAHCYTTVLMPTNDGTLYRLRRPGQPETVHEEIYHQFGITTAGLPKSEVVIENEKVETL